MANYQEHKFWLDHPEQVKALTDLCAKCPALYLKDEYPHNQPRVPDVPYCVKNELHLEWVLPLLYDGETGQWDHGPGVCCNFGYLPKEDQIEGLKKGQVI